jgi:hypothetical protein
LAAIARHPAKIVRTSTGEASRCALDLRRDQVTALKAHVFNGKIFVDEPVDLPDGSGMRDYLYDAAPGDSASKASRLSSRRQS